MPYLPPFNVIKRLVEMSTSKGQLIATASYENLVMMIKLLLSAVEVNERWYLTQYPDVADAIAQGKTPSARQHFIDNGYFEGRLPFPIPVDEDWYKRIPRCGREHTARLRPVRPGAFRSRWIQGGTPAVPNMSGHASA